MLHVYETAHDPLLRRVAGPAGVAAYCRSCRAGARESVVATLQSSRAAPTVRKLLLRRGDPRATILTTANRLGADLLAVGSHARSPIVGVLLGSVAEGVLRHALCDVLIVPPAS